MVCHMLLSLWSCNRTDNRKIETTYLHSDTISIVKNNIDIGDSSKSIDSLIRIAIKKGDTSAYKKVHVYYAERVRDQETLTLSIIMAHKYNYNYAYFTVYTTLANQEEYGLKDLDEQTQNMALYYLLRSFELGYKDAMNSIKEEFGKPNPIPKSSYYLNKMLDFDTKENKNRTV